jgi:hypothetical protein
MIHFRRSSVRKLALSNDLPRLSPIEEIDAPTDLTRLKRKRTFKGGRRSRDPEIGLQVAEPPRSNRGLMMLMFAAGCVLGVCGIEIASVLHSHASSATPVTSQRLIVAAPSAPSF